MHEEYKLLNHGLLRLVEYMGAEDKGIDEKLVNYLMQRSYNTPFESVVVTFEIKAPIFIIRQWQTHLTQSYNELKGKHKALAEEFYIPGLNQTTSTPTGNNRMQTDEQNENAETIGALIQGQSSEAFSIYHHLLELGCPREIADSVLPLGTYTHMFATANLYNWFHFLREHLHPHAQYEVMVYAEAILEELKQVAPIAVRAFLKTLGDDYEF